ncbi:hypothetical protein BOTBODRAFT_113755, partial [Botryobasidium botryosum FD-172 SS1]
QYVQMKDVYERQRNRPSKFVQETCYGQIKRIVSFAIRPSHHFQQTREPVHVVLAVITPCNIGKRDRLGAAHYITVGPYAIVDVSYIEALVGRVKDPQGNSWAIIKREGLFSRIKLANDDELELEASATLGTHT